jgi:hypothetical protein
VLEGLKDLWPNYYRPLHNYILIYGAWLGRYIILTYEDKCIQIQLLKVNKKKSKKIENTA